VELTLTDVDAIVALALSEDVGAGDLTGEAVIPGDLTCSAVITAKAPGVVCGVGAVESVYRALDPDVRVSTLAGDGTVVDACPIEIATIAGRARAVLAGERTALNLLGRLSGVATATRAYVQAVAGTGVGILDTRKTMPGLRALEKYAVACGGGVNHRMGLYDAILLKDNHLHIAGGVGPAIALARAAHPDMPVTVEVENLQQLQEAVSFAAERIMLDNMPADMMREAVRIVAGSAEVEASGGITLANVRDVALTGVDVISVGAVTHSALWLDVSMEVQS
jgi:nicotinate-nucleotide pyrophosphorylase (carboxylating)